MRSTVAVALAVLLVGSAVAPVAGGEASAVRVGGERLDGPRSTAVELRSSGADDATGSTDPCERVADVPDVLDATGPAAPDGRPTIVGLHPSPLADGDAGEAAFVHFPKSTPTAGWTLVDDEGDRATLPNRTLEGTVALSVDPEAADRHADGTVHGLDGQLRLADGEEELALRRPNGTVVDRVAYSNADDGDRYALTAAGWGWHHPDATRFDPVASRPGNATAFVLPDAPGVPIRTLENASDRIRLVGYTLTSDRVVDALVAAHGRGADVRVLVEGEPVGRTSRAQLDALNRLASAGVAVDVLAGDAERYRTHHPKYAVVDETTLVLSENWKPAGVGGRSSRGWGVRLRDERLADAMAEVYRADACARDALAWREHRPSVDPRAPTPARGSFPQQFAPERVPVERARLLLAPDNAESELTTLLRGADESILIQQVGIEGPDFPLLRASFAAARNGTEVRILLSSEYYVQEENRRLAETLRQRADRRGLPVTVELVDPGGAFEKSHVKGVVVDERHVVVGSLNWNPTALRENREAVVVLTGDEVGSYYAEVFRADAGPGPGEDLPVAFFAVVAAACLVLVVVVAGRLRWL